MPSDKKLIAAAAHTAEQAKLLKQGVANAHRKVERAEEDVEAARDALEKMQEQYEAAQDEADEAREAASGLSTFVEAGSAEIGVVN
jgi:nitrogen fixation/metabolism regulation signal transduction histidine kinase